MRKILVPIDSTEYDYTFRAVEVAIEVASSCGGDEDPELILLHVLRSMSGLPENLMEKEKELEKRRVNGEFENIKDLCEEEGIRNVKTVIKDRNSQSKGEVDYHIIRTAQEENVDLIVIGSGRIHDGSLGGRIKKAMYGSVTEKVLHEAPCSILIARI